MTQTLFKPHTLLMLSLLGLTSTGCALIQPAQESPDAEAPPVVEVPTPPPASYPRDSLSNLLMAEVAAQRQEFHLASGLYSVEAQRLNDPLITEQAARLAAYIGDLIEAERMARLWHEQEPDNAAALEILVLTSLRREDRHSAEQHVQQMLGLDTTQGITRLVVQSQSLDASQQRMLLDILSSLAERYPTQVALWHARTLHLQKDSPEQALAAAETGLKLSPHHEELLVQKGNLLFQLDRTTAAKRHFTRQLKRIPESQRLRMSYLRNLLVQEDDDAILEQMDFLMEKNAGDPELLFGIVMYAIEKGHRDSVQSTLDALLAQNYRSDDIHFALGHYALSQDDHDEAIEQFSQVQQGNRYIAAHVNLALAYLKKGLSLQSRQEMNQLRHAYPAQAPDLYALEASWYSDQQDHRTTYQLLSLGLELVPNHEVLLYSRAMTADRLQRIDWMETDLRQMLIINPDNPMALNALGYTLLDKTDRIDEGFALVQRAYAIKPQEPAIIDSMGWGYYRTGNLPKALEYLEQAYQQFPDPEVAAHLGEVLWHLDRQQEAQKIWQDALKKSPNDKQILEVRARLTGQKQP